VNASPLSPRWLSTLRGLLRDERVKRLLQQHAIVLELNGARHYWFSVVNIFYQRHSVKIEKTGYKASCDCEGFSKWDAQCFHIDAARAYLLVNKLRGAGINTDELIYGLPLSQGSDDRGERQPRSDSKPAGNKADHQRNTNARRVAPERAAGRVRP